MKTNKLPVLIAPEAHSLAIIRLIPLQLKLYHLSS